MWIIGLKIFLQMNNDDSCRYLLLTFFGIADMIEVDCIFVTVPYELKA